MPPGTPESIDHLLDALVAQFAAGQSEALYGLHSATATLRRQTADLTGAVEGLAEELRPHFQALLQSIADRTAEQAAANIAGHIAELHESVSEDTKRHATNLTATVKRSTIAVEKAAYEAAERARVERTLVEQVVTEGLKQVKDAHDVVAAHLDEVTARHVSAVQEANNARAELTEATNLVGVSLDSASEAFEVQMRAATEDSTAAIHEAGAHAVTEIEGATDVALTRLEHATARLEALAEEVRTTSAESLQALTDTSAQFAADASAATTALERVGENIVNRLIVVLEDRDRLDRQVEDRFAKRATKITNEIEAKVKAATDELKAQAELARAQDTADRATAAAQLNDLLDRLLGLPRGKLKDLRSKNEESS